MLSNLQRKADKITENLGDLALSQLDATLELGDTLGDKLQASITLQEESKTVLEAILNKEVKDAPTADFTATNDLLQRLLDKEDEPIQITLTIK